MTVENNIYACHLDWLWSQGRLHHGMHRCALSKTSCHGSVVFSADSSLMLVSWLVCLSHIALHLYEGWYVLQLLSLDLTRRLKCVLKAPGLHKSLCNEYTMFWTNPIRACLKYIWQSGSSEIVTYIVIAEPISMHHHKVDGASMWAREPIGCICETEFWRSISH